MQTNVPKTRKPVYGGRIPRYSVRLGSRQSKCVKGQKPFALSGDTISWTMSIAPGSECIQGLRWSYMQIYSVLLSKAPKNGKIVVLGSGFRYVADPQNQEPESFTLVVLGKNRHDPGKSTLEITVSRS